MICDILINIFVYLFRLLEVVYVDNQDMLGEVFVFFVDIVSYMMIFFFNYNIRIIDGI